MGRVRHLDGGMDMKPSRFTEEQIIGILRAIVLRERVSRGRIKSRLANLPPCLIGIEAGMATHYVARELAALGHDVKQVPPAYAKPFRQGHKNDFRDALAVAEAVQRPTTRLFLPSCAGTTTAFIFFPLDPRGRSENCREIRDGDGPSSGFGCELTLIVENTEAWF